MHALLLVTPHVGAFQTGRPALTLTKGVLSPSLAAPQSASPERYQSLGSDPGKGEMASLFSEEAVRLRTDRNA